MYQIGDEVLYGIHGVCKITDVEERVVDRKHLRYFVLEPRDQAGARFLMPTHNEAALAKLRPVMSREDLETLLRSDAVRQDAWIPDESQRKQRYRELITGSDRTQLLQMVRSLHKHKHKQAQAQAGRKFHLCDENFLRDAERLINAEFALILDIEPKQVQSYVLSVLNEE